MPKDKWKPISSRRIRKRLKTMPRVNGRLVKRNKIVTDNNQALDLAEAADATVAQSDLGLVDLDVKLGLNLNPESEFQIRQQLLPQPKATACFSQSSSSSSRIGNGRKDVRDNRDDLENDPGVNRHRRMAIVGDNVTRDEVHRSFELLKYLELCGLILIREKSPTLIRIKIQLFLSGLVTTTTSAKAGLSSETAEVPQTSSPSSSSKDVTTTTSADSTEDPDPPQTHTRTPQTKVYSRNEKRVPETTAPNKVPVQNSPPILSTSDSDANFENFEDFIKEEPEEVDGGEPEGSIPESGEVSIKEEFEEESIIQDSIEDTNEEQHDDEDEESESVPEPESESIPEPTRIFPESKYRFCTAWTPDADEPPIPNFENPRLPPPDPIDPLNRPQLPHHLRFKGKLKCPEVGCGKILPSVRSFREHKRLQHSNLPKPPAPAPESHLCSICGTVYKTKEGLDHHLTTHSGVPPEKTFLCDQCPKAYYRALNLRDHVIQNHPGQEKPKHKCPVCGKGFYLKQWLRRHSDVHLAEKAFKCEFCDKAFRTKKTLAQHLGIHTGVKKYKCGPCGLAFVQIGSLKYHNRMHHGETGTEPAPAWRRAGPLQAEGTTATTLCRNE